MISDAIYLAFGWTEGILIALVLLLLFGAKKIPELMKGLGGGMKEFKKAAKDEDEDEANRPRPQVENRSTSSGDKKTTQNQATEEKRYSAEGK